MPDPCIIPAEISRKVDVKPSINQEPHQTQNYVGEYKESVGSCRVLRVSFSWVSGFSLVLDSRDRLGCLRGKAGSGCE